MPALGESPVTAADGAVLALDLGSPVASAAIARGGVTLAAAVWTRSAGDDEPLARIGALLARAATRATELGGVVALRGPGSFTGLRVACATALALSAAAGARATGVSSLEALALTAPPRTGALVAAVDALRGEWFVQRFDRGAGDAARALDEPRRIPASELRELAGSNPVCGFGLAPGVSNLEPVDGLAPAVALAATSGRWDWDAALLTRPLYLRSPATTPSPPR